MSNRTLASWPRRFGTAISQLWNVLLNGNEDDSFSSRSWKAREKGKAWGKVAVVLIDAVFGKGHCERAVERDEL
jgi:hypothetical protein